MSRNPITIKGYVTLKRRWEEAGKTLHEVVGPAILAGADTVVADARFLVPKDTGKLAGTIQRSGLLTSKKGNPYAVISAGDSSTMVGERKNFQLARIIEYGTKSHTSQPFLRPAMRRNAREIRATIRKAIREAIKIANGG